LSSPIKVKDKKAKIFIVDDHPLLRQGLAQLINQEGNMSSAGEAGDAREALQGIEKVKPDLAIVDISLKGTSGIELTRNILAKHPKILVLIISMYDESVYLERALKAGAKGYLMKQETTDHIITAIHTVLRGDIYVSDKWRDKIVNQFGSGERGSRRPPRGSLSERELEVLQFIGQGYSTQKIAEELHVSVKTVETHYANIKNKLDLKNSHELIQYAVKWCLSEK
jgi:DNA-binding NarL/FixJ family response regulator